MTSFSDIHRFPSKLFIKKYTLASHKLDIHIDNYRTIFDEDISKLLKQGYYSRKLQTTFRKFYSRDEQKPKYPDRLV